MYVERTFEVDRPLSEVWAFLSDFTTTEQWDPGTDTTTRTSGDGGLGTVYRNVSTFMGRHVELRYETVTFRAPGSEPDHPATAVVQFRGTNGGTSATDWLTLTGLDGGGPDSDDTGRTRIHYRADFLFSPLLRWVPLVIRGRLDALADETVASIRRCLA